MAHDCKVEGVEVICRNSIPKSVQMLLEAERRKKGMFVKRLLSVLLSIMLVFSAFGGAFANDAAALESAEFFNFQEENENYATAMFCQM